jgi:hypothetical protein
MDGPETRGHETDTPRTRVRGQSVLPYHIPSAIIAHLKGHSEGVYHFREVAESIGIRNPDTVGRTLRRLSGTGSGAGPVMALGNGYFRYSEEEKIPLVDKITQSARVGIENFLVQKCAPACTFTPPTPSPRTRSPDMPADTSRTKFQNPPVDIADTADTGTDTSRTPSPKPGYPLLLPTGQRVEWHIYPSTGQEQIHFIVNGKSPFPFEFFLYLIEGLRKDGLDNGWWVVSCEGNLDSKKVQICQAVTMEVCEGLIYKLYQHGNFARLEIADRRAVPFGEAFLAILEAADRGMGASALKKAVTVEKTLDDIAADNRKLHRYMDGISERVADMAGRRKNHGKNGRPRKEKELIPADPVGALVEDVMKK